MKIIKKVIEMQKVVKRLHEEGKSIGFVPTMGALHEGHLSLMRRAAKENDVVIVSIFVNPAQFGPKEDYRRYPRNLKRDAELCKKVGVDYIFAPSVEEIYPKNYVTCVNIEGRFTETLEGKSRPGHFRGVATVVAKLFNIVQPDKVYFGEKDYQQLLVVKRTVSDMNMPVKIIPCPTIREKDGLAMSSRNVYLSLDERKTALILSRTLKTVAGCKLQVASEIKKKIVSIVSQEPRIKLDYVAVRDGGTFEPVKKIKKGCVVLLAVKIGKTRLIDNVKI